MRYWSQEKFIWGMAFLCLLVPTSLQAALCAPENEVEVREIGDDRKQVIRKNFTGDTISIDTLSRTGLLDSLAQNYQKSELVYLGKIAEVSPGDDVDSVWIEVLATYKGNTGWRRFGFAHSSFLNPYPPLLNKVFLYMGSEEGKNLSQGGVLVSDCKDEPHGFWVVDESATDWEITLSPLYKDANFKVSLDEASKSFLRQGSVKYFLDPVVLPQEKESKLQLWVKDLYSCGTTFENVMVTVVENRIDLTFKALSRPGVAWCDTNFTPYGPVYSLPPLVPGTYQVRVKNIPACNNPDSCVPFGPPVWEEAGYVYVQPQTSLIIQSNPGISGNLAAETKPVLRNRLEMLFKAPGATGKSRWISVLGR